MSTSFQPLELLVTTDISAHQNRLFSLCYQFAKFRLSNDGYCTYNNTSSYAIWTNWMVRHNPNVVWNKAKKVYCMCCIYTRHIPLQWQNTMNWHVWWWCVFTVWSTEIRVFMHWHGMFTVHNFLAYKTKQCSEKHRDDKVQNSNKFVRAI
jgi:hypothetical protein